MKLVVCAKLIKIYWSLPSIHVPNSIFMLLNVATTTVSFRYQRIANIFFVLHMQLGVDDLVFPWFRNLHLKRSQEVFSMNSISECWKLARHGLPNARRPSLWKLGLGLKPTLDRLAEKVCSHLYTSLKYISNTLWLCLLYFGQVELCHTNGPIKFGERLMGS